MKLVKYMLMIAALVGASILRAQTSPPLIVQCQSPWASVGPYGTSLGGCNSYVDETKPAIYFGAPQPASLVYNDANDQWAICQDLPATAHVYTAPGHQQWDDASLLAGLVKIPVGNLCAVSTPVPPNPTPQPGNGSITVNWTAPDHNTDGTLLPPGALIGYRIFYGLNPAQLDHSVDVSGGGTLIYQITGLVSGHWFVGLTARTATEESDLSNLADINVVSVTPTQTFSTIDTVAYKQTQQINGYAMNRVGTIPLKTLCNSAHLVDGYNPLLDRTLVTYTCGVAQTPCPPNKIIMPTTAYARCALQ